MATLQYRVNEDGDGDSIATGRHSQEAGPQGGCKLISSVITSSTGN